MFFYMLNGRVDKLNIMETLLRKNEDNSRRFTNSLYTCNIEERIKMLNETGHRKFYLILKFLIKFYLILKFFYLIFI
jgi:hypothetical protein